MKERLKQLLKANKSMDGTVDVVFSEFGLNKDKHYDILVVAPTWDAPKIMGEFNDADITCTMEHSYVSGYEVNVKEYTMAWIKCSPGACCLIDELSICAYLHFDKLVFIGSVGGLNPEVRVGDLYTPESCIVGNLANAYLEENILEYKPFNKVYPNDTEFVEKVIKMAEEMNLSIKKAPVFCTDSVLGEYAHIDFIKSFNVDLIEMETSSFYTMADLMEKPAVALMIVSDNSSVGEHLLAGTEDQKERYHNGRKYAIPQLLISIAKM